MNAEMVNYASGTAARPARSERTKIPVKCRRRNRFIPAFLAGTAVLAILSLLYLDIDWAKMASRVPDIGLVFWDLFHLDFSNMDLILSSLVETISIAVLSLLYSLVLGILFGMLAARNIFRLSWLSVLTQSFFTFLRAVPTPVWVLLMLVCLGMGPEAGVAGLCVHTTAFFTKSFAQSFESIPDETIEALEVTGASRLSIFVNAVLPAALSQIVAWALECAWRPTSPSAPFWVWWAPVAVATSSPTASRATITVPPGWRSCWCSWWPTASSGSLSGLRKNSIKKFAKLYFSKGTASRLTGGIPQTVGLLAVPFAEYFERDA